MSEYFGRAHVRAARDVAADVRLLEIVPEAGVRAYPTGSHLDLAVVIDGLPDTRSYSLVGEHPVSGAYRIAVKEVADSRGGSQLVRSMEPGAQLDVSRPKGDFELQFGRPEYLLVAGGIGITPIVGMAEALTRHGQRFRLLYAVRRRDQLAFGQELSELIGDRLEVFVSADGRRVDLASEIDRLHPDGELYLCGPLRLRDAAQRAWRERGRRADRLRFETFASGGRFASEPFRVRVRDRGDREVVVPRDRTMLDALIDQGVEVMWDCRRGECGLCRVTVLASDGALDHRDVFLSEEEAAEGCSLLACVSRVAGGSVTIDSGFRDDPLAELGNPPAMNPTRSPCSPALT
jgi:ferredoxin-NADP reductase